MTYALIIIVAIVGFIAGYTKGHSHGCSDMIKAIKPTLTEEQIDIAIKHAESKLKEFRR